MSEEWLIFPVVRRLVSRLAKISGAVLISTGMGIVGVLLFCLGLNGLGSCLVVCSNINFMLYLCLLALLLLWSHEVLLAGRGLALTRFVLCFSLFLCLLMLVCGLYSIFSIQPLLVRQGEIPFLLWGLLFFSILLNLGNMAAAPFRWKLLLGLHMLLVLLVLLFLSPLLVVPCEICKILAIATGVPLMLRLKRMAPQIVSLPEKERAPHVGKR